MTTFNYSSDRVEFAWAGLDFKEGFATGTYLQEAATTPDFSVKPTASGSIVRVFNADDSGTLTVTVDQESKLHQQLIAISKADRNTRDQVFAGKLNDTSNSQVTNYKNMFITNQPDESRGTESATFAWVFMFEAKNTDEVVNPTNIVGN